ncbi:hypothetical protein OIDMADRAFT_23873 [Oidiodendron maius Zn]|uniref:Heterokaryon incompatibility domain-containing protein n=1 Tax=Oidiodendron maius (strain Zn) TaxID=913774 RepID=A0A0C3I282_OIDMZ|nr:hypothetical protein OIDMADRAFT_23873 [Oidiodendron maius Zn]
MNSPSLPPISTQEFYAGIALPSKSASIRLLELDGLQRTDDATLRGSLRVAHLHESFRFSALSYAWLDKEIETHTYVIECSLPSSPRRCLVKITINCHRALEQIRKRFGSVTIWVDSICINQDDDDEKADQIPLMQQIFAGAETLLVWLGPGSEESDRAVAYVKRFATWGERLPLAYLATQSEDEGKLELQKFRQKVWMDVPGRLRSFIDSRRPPDLSTLLDCNWVHRGWTFQELILSSQPIILCGDKMLPWEDLVSFITHYAFEARKSKSFGVCWHLVEHWHALVELWLHFPRQGLRAEATADTENAGKMSFSTAIEHFDKSGRRPWGMRVVSATIQVAFWMSMLGSWAYVLYKIYGCDYDCGYYAQLENFIWPAAWGTLAILLFGLFISRCLYTLFGEWLRWPLRRSLLSKNPLESVGSLSGIRTALRERSCSEPHDRAFALFGILGSLGVNTPRPDYRQDVAKTYQDLFQCLLAWHPRAFLMMVDADSQTHVDGPSWVPNWAAPPQNSWLLSRYGNDSELGIKANAPREPPFNNIGPMLMLKGHAEGFVLFNIRFNQTHTGHTERSTCLALNQLVRWFHRLHRLRRERARIITLAFEFATLEGLRPAREPRSSEQGVTVRYKGEKFEVKVPFHFANHGTEFGAFCRLCEILDPIVVQYSIHGGEAQNSALVSRIFARLKEDKRLLDYFRGLVSRIEADRRCAFILSTGVTGTGSLGIRADDVVFEFCGLRTRMALRREPNASAYKVVGAALVAKSSSINEPQWEDVTLV